MELVFLISEDGSEIELFIFSLALIYSNIAVLSGSFSNFNDTPSLVGQKKCNSAKNLTCLESNNCRKSFYKLTKILLKNLQIWVS